MKNPPNPDPLRSISLIHGYCGTMVFFPEQMKKQCGVLDKTDALKNKKGE